MQRENANVAQLAAGAQASRPVLVMNLPLLPCLINPFPPRISGHALAQAECLICHLTTKIKIKIRKKKSLEDGHQPGTKPHSLLILNDTYMADPCVPLPMTTLAIQ